MNATTFSNRSSSFSSTLADIRHAQRRLAQLNRPWIAKRPSTGAGPADFPGAAAQ